ncbi:HAD family hydrolase [Bifidobacterium stellenboschense]|uniref:Phosphatase/phosphohexomutase n=1 Tax=Bifidobacterium stellenboschense TaxID=762211 RepID=A0A087DT51_9BIFI|nr:HAD family phosphatase [Bifidobacterium stellenboschense]KFI98701.1 phosphatase/phosphohexomutase [Bifidobacterium stellenboschense]
MNGTDVAPCIAITAGGHTYETRAVLWDLDGTLVDSDPMWVEAERRCAERHGVAWSDALSRAMTAAPLPVCARVLREAGVGESADAVIRGLVADVTAMYEAGAGRGAGNGASIPWTPGAGDLMLALRAASVPSVLVTGSPRSLGERVIAAAPAGVFAGLVAGDDGLAHKPDPAPYLAGARLAGADPRDCLVFEDSAGGLTAALAAGAHAVGVEACARVPLPRGMGCPIVESLEEISSATPR